jgi:hypothetical protein
MEGLKTSEKRTESGVGVLHSHCPSTHGPREDPGVLPTRDPRQQRRKERWLWVFWKSVHENGWVQAYRLPCALSLGGRNL